MNKLIIDKNKYIISNDFIYYYLPNYIYKNIINNLDTKVFKKFDIELGINSINAIKFALRNLLITEDQNKYIIEINKNLVYQGKNLSSIINLIEYGNLNIKRCPIISTVFRLIHDNLGIIIKRWQNGY